ncbi:MAG: protein kinase [Phaeodactylibacter sp.]|nr:protein kinase [Phaeodactylibacter sp.]MCB9051526.1 protein kinase [Lewinellaceae bacterium]
MRGLNPKDLFADRYRLHKQLAHDGLSESWLAHNEIIGSEQVVKIYNALDEPGTRIFRRDFARAYHLMHPRLLQVIYFDVHEDRPYLVLPYVRRGSIYRLTGKLGEGEIARVMRDVCAALAYIHQPAYNIVHHDIRPDNILLSEQGHYMLSIYGISPELRYAYLRDATDEEIAAFADAGAELPAYRPPEEVTGEGANKKAGAASDIWALGATLYELAVGHPPFGKEGGERQRHGEVAAQLPSSFSPGLNNILKHCLNKNPEARPSADSLRQMAEAYLNEGQWPEQYQGGSGQAWNPSGRRVMAITPKVERIGALAEAVLSSLVPKIKRIPALAGPVSAAFTSSVKRVAPLAVAVLAALVVVTGLILFWPKMTGENTLVSNRNDIPDTSISEPTTQKLSVRNEEMVPVEAKNNTTTGPGQKTTEEKKPALKIPEDIIPIPGPPPEEEKKAVSPPAERQPKERTAQNRSTQVKSPPATVKKTAPQPPKKQQAPPGPGTEPKNQTLRPQFNDVTSKWGYVDKSGTWIIWPQFEKAGPFEDGKATVALKDKRSGELKSYTLNPNGELTRLPEPDVVENQNN